MHERRERQEKTVLGRSNVQGAGHEDEAFYFEQLVDHLSSGKHLPLTEEEMTRALGV